jgi:hypothetical protein
MRLEIGEHLGCAIIVFILTAGFVLVVCAIEGAFN